MTSKIVLPSIDNHSKCISITFMKKMLHVRYYNESIVEFLLVFSICSWHKWNTDNHDKSNILSELLPYFRPPRCRKISYCRHLVSNSFMGLKTIGRCFSVPPWQTFFVLQWKSKLWTTVHNILPSIFFKLYLCYFRLKLRKCLLKFWIAHRILNSSWPFCILHWNSDE